MDREGRELSYGVTVIDWDGKVLSLKPEHEIRAQLDVLREAGVRWVMVGGIHMVEKANFDRAEGARQIRRMLDEYGMRVSSHHTVQPSLAPVGEDQAPVNEMMRKAIEYGAAFEPRSHVFHSGSLVGNFVHGADMFKPFDDEVARVGLDRVLETMADNIRAWGDVAAEHGTRISLENLGRYLQTTDMERMPRLVDMIDHPCVGYCIDSGHAHTWGESTAEWIRLAGKKLFETHFHDNRGLAIRKYPDAKNAVSTPDTDEHLPVGFGTISWMDVILALDEIGFPGPVTFETGGWPIDDKVESYRQAIRWWHACETMARERANKK